MNQIGQIKIRDIKELQNEEVILPNNALTPLKKRKNLKSVTTSKKIKLKHDNETVIDASTTNKKIAKKVSRKSALKDTPSNQKRIDSFFTACAKTYEIKFPKEEPLSTSVKLKAQTTDAKRKGNRNSTHKTIKKSPRRSRARRKRLFTDSTTEPSADNMSALSFKVTNKQEPSECITIDSDSEDENNLKVVGAENVLINKCTLDINSNSTNNNCKTSLKSSLPTTTSSLSFGQRMSLTSCENPKSISTDSATSSAPRRKKKPCPPYKIIENTTFAVDAFQFGYIDNVSHYFLTHFHADHYIGLTKSFAMPLYVSPTTARLLRTFIKVDEQYINELELNQSYIINDIEVTALDANHCPGSILLVFKFKDSGKCILHTGDFRACHEMESEPILWNNNIHTIYLDTTYLSDKYAFCTQYESIMKAQDLIEKFQTKHSGKRILYICGSYIIGKEKFWSSLAEKFELKVWAEGNRYKALKAIDEDRFNRLLVEDPNEANMHILSMIKLSYLELVEYVKLYEQQYDIVFAMRPSGWEKNNKPRYGNKINVVGIEYSEHSSYTEMQRFVKFLKPEQVISTVPSGKDLMKTPQIPLNWYKYNELKPSSNYQPSVDSFLAKTPINKLSTRLMKLNKSQLENVVSPLKFSNANEDKTDDSNSTKVLKNANNELNKTNKKEISAQNSPTHLYNHENAAKIKTTTAISITNSSEDFEKTDFAITTQNLKQRETKKELQEKNKNVLNKTKNKCNRKQLQQKNTKIKTIAKNSEEYFETPDKEQKRRNKIQIKHKDANDNEIVVGNNEDKTANANSLSYSSEEEINAFPTQFQTTTNQITKQKDFGIPISQKRITRSKTESTKSTKNFNVSQNKANDEYTMKSFKETRLQRKATIKSPNRSTMETSSSKELPESSKQNLVISTTQNRLTRSKSALSDATINTPSSQNNTAEEFKSKLITLTDQNNILAGAKLNSTKNFNTSQENPIFKSTTESNVDPSSGDEIQHKYLNRKVTKSNSPTNSDANWLDKFENKIKSFKSKRRTLNEGLAPFKKNKLSIDTQTILNNILEEREDIDRFNCSQLAGLVVETVNKLCPDNNKDHIPADLLSDADDDWM